MEGQADAVLGVRVVEQHRVGREVLDVTADLDHERNRAKGVGQPARSAVLGQDAGKPVAEREVMVGPPGRDPVDRDSSHHEVGVGQRLEPLHRGADRHLPVRCLVQPFGQLSHPCEGGGVRVDQPEFGAAKFGHAEHIAQQLDPEGDASDPDGDKLHGGSLDVPPSRFSHVRSVSSTSIGPLRIWTVPWTRRGGIPTSA